MEDKNKVIIKSIKNGIRLILDNELDFEKLILEIAKKFAEGRHFFGDSTVCLSIEGRELTEYEEIRILDVIAENCDLKIICIVGGEDERMNRHFIHALKQAEDSILDKDKARFFRGGLTDGMSITCDECIVIIGDVNPGCKVTSKGSIIILGSLYGEVHAGFDKDCFVIALEMSPEALSIGDNYFIPAVKPKWGIKHKLLPQIATLKDEKIVFDNLNKSALESVYAL